MSKEQTRQEFARQAVTMASAPVFNAQEVIAAIVEASAHGSERKTLDVGCGPGIVVEALGQRGGEVVGIDLTPEMLQQANQRCRQAGLSNVELICGPAERLNFPPGHFDAAVSRATLHHLQDPSAVLAEMARVVKPGGRIALADIVSSEDAAPAQLHNALEILRDPSHTRMLALSELLALAQSAELKLVDQKCWEQHREFGEWMKIANAPQREAPLRVVMENCARAGLHAGIDLQRRDGRITFTHRLVLLVLERA